MRYLWLLGSLALVGCSLTRSEVSPPPAELRTVYRLETPRGFREFELTRTTFSQERFIRGEWQAAWAALPAIYEELGVGGSAVLNADEHLFGRRWMQARGSLGEVRMSRLLRCGSLHLGGEDRFNVALTVMSELSPSTGGSTIRTWVDASARDNTGPGSPPVQCASTGWLEQEIADRLAEQAGPAHSSR